MRRSLLCAVALGTLLGLAYLAEGLTYPRGTLAQPGPSLYPILVGLLLVLSSLGIGLELRGHRLQEAVEWPKGAERLRVIAVAAASLCFVLLLPYLGYPLAGTLLTLVVLQVMGLRHWPIMLGLSLGVGLGSYYLFGVLLSVPLPMGTWLG